MRSNRYLLDTCALIWLVQKSDRLSAAVRQSLVQAADIFISPVTAWEIAVKCQSGKMKLPLDPGEWFRGSIFFWVCYKICIIIAGVFIT